jgi:hypothetical protein
VRFDCGDDVSRNLRGLTVRGNAGADIAATPDRAKEVRVRSAGGE